MPDVAAQQQFWGEEAELPTGSEKRPCPLERMCVGTGALLRVQMPWGGGSGVYLPPPVFDVSGHRLERGILASSATVHLRKAQEMRETVLTIEPTRFRVPGAFMPPRRTGIRARSMWGEGKFWLSWCRQRAQEEGAGWIQIGPLGQGKTKSPRPQAGWELGRAGRPRQAIPRGGDGRME